MSVTILANAVTVATNNGTKVIPLQFSGTRLLILQVEMTYESAPTDGLLLSVCPGVSDPGNNIALVLSTPDPNSTFCPTLPVAGASNAITGGNNPLTVVSDIRINEQDYPDYGVLYFVNPDASQACTLTVKLYTN